MPDNIMSAEDRARAMQMLGGGAASQAGRQLMGRGQMLQQQEAAAMGEAPMEMAPNPVGGPPQPQPMMAPPPAMPPQASKPPAILRKLAEMLRGAR